LLAVTPNDWVNTLAAQRFRSIFGSERCYQLPPADASERDRASHRYLQARWLFGAEHDYADLAQRYERGARMRATSITESYTYKMFREGRPDALPLFVITEAGRLALATAEKPLKPVAGQTLVSLRTQPADKPPGDRPAETTPADSAAR